MPGIRRHRSPSPKPKRPRSEKKTVNMLDVDAITELKNSTGSSNRKMDTERITCTIPGSRRGINDRISGDFRNGDRRVSMHGSITKPHLTPKNRKERRAVLLSRVSRSDEKHHHRSRREDEEDDERRKNGAWREDNSKPVQRLIDPTFVPKSKVFFDHDDRGGDREWKGRSTYDPRIDFGPRRHRSSNWEGFGDRRSRDRGIGYKSRGRGDRRRDDEKSAGINGLWAHDKFVDVEDSKDKKEDETEVVVEQKKSQRYVRDDSD